MSRKVDPMLVRHGDLVRVAGQSFSQERTDPVNTRHHIKAGAVCSVVSVYGRDVVIIGPARHDIRQGEAPLGHTWKKYTQCVNINQITLAKQATKRKVSK